MGASSTQLPEEVLLRSRIEIAQVLDSLRIAQDPVVTYLEGGETVFVTRLLEVAPDAGHIVVDFGASKTGNADLISLRHIRFVCSHGKGRIEFVAANPREFVCEQHVALMLDFPESLIRLQRRRWLRVRVPAARLVLCTFEIAPGLTVEGRLVDASANGYGAILVDSEVRLDRGEVVRGARITESRRVHFVADIEIINRTSIMVHERAMQRFGCKFRISDDALGRVMDAFVVDLSAD